MNLDLPFCIIVPFERVDPEGGAGGGAVVEDHHLPGVHFPSRATPARQKLVSLSCRIHRLKMCIIFLKMNIIFHYNYSFQNYCTVLWT